MRFLVVHDIAGHADDLQALAARERLTASDSIVALGGSDRPHAGAPALLVDPQLLNCLSGAGAPVYLLPGAGDGPLDQLQQALQPYAGQIELIHRTAAALGAHDVVAGFGGQVGGAGGPGILRAAEWEVRAAFERLASQSLRFQTAQRRVLLLAARPDAQTSPALNTLLRIYQPHLVLYASQEPANEPIDGVWAVSPGSLDAGWYALVDPLKRQAVFKQLERPPRPAATIERPAMIHRSIA